MINSIDRRRFLCGLGASLGVATIACGRTSTPPSIEARPPITVARPPITTARPPTWLADIDRRIETRRIAELVVPSGFLVACDPLVGFDNASPFSDTVAPGRYPVELGMKGGDVAFALLRFAGRPISSWTLAVSSSDDPDELMRGEAVGYAVDSGLGGFADQAATMAVRAENQAINDEVGNELARRGIDTGDAGRWHSEWQRIEDDLRRDRPDLLTRLRAAGIESNRWAAVVVDSASGANVLAFSSGAGDGVYASWWGKDDKGDMAALVTDFGLENDD